MSAKSYGQRAETVLRDELQRRGYLVIRSAASKALDLVCVRPDGTPVGLECKRTHHGRCLYISKSKMMQEQRAYLCAVERRYNMQVYYAVWWGNDEFEFFYPDETILKAGHGVSLSFAFPHCKHFEPAEVVHSPLCEEAAARFGDVRVPPNTPPYSPPVSSTQDGDYIAPDGEPRDGGGCTD